MGSMFGFDWEPTEKALIFCHAFSVTFLEGLFCRDWGWVFGSLVLWGSTQHYAKLLLNSKCSTNHATYYEDLLYMTLYCMHAELVIDWNTEKYKCIYCHYMLDTYNFYCGVAFIMSSISNELCTLRRKYWQDWIFLKGQIIWQNDEFLEDKNNE